MSVKAWFLSDLHLRDEQESNSQKLLLFLHSLAEGEPSATHLFLVGDIFDLWIHNHTYFVDKFAKIVNAIRVVVSSGIEVHYFEGNHDLYLKKFWQQDVGVKVHDGPEFFSLGSKKFRIEHGDLMNPEDTGYLFLKKALHSFPLQNIAKGLPGQAVSWIGERASRASRHYTSNQKALRDEQVKTMMHRFAHEVMEDSDIDYLITGHTHVLDTYHFEDNGQQKTFVNLGSWFEEQKVFCFDGKEDSFISL